MKSEHAAVELSMKLKYDKKKSKLHEVIEQKLDLEKVAKELYDELQNSLIVTKRLQFDNDELVGRLDEIRIKDTDSGILREKLEMEFERNEKLEKQNEALLKEYNRVKNAYQDLITHNEKTELHVLELKEDIVELQHELEKNKNRCNVLLKDNHSFEDNVKELRNRIAGLNDKIVEIKGSIRVLCRVKPIFDDEIKKLDMPMEDLESLVRYPDYNLLEFNSVPFEFDRVFDVYSSQHQVYDEVEPYIRSVLSGCKVCVFAYGQTGKWIFVITIHTSI